MLKVLEEMNDQGFLSEDYRVKVKKIIILIIVGGLLTLGSILIRIFLK